ncbi:MAG: chorismate synthase [Candidatus Omnitrophota bacterium]
MRILTAGESHGLYEVAIVEGFPEGVKIERAFIDRELKRRMSGFGRGKRMEIEQDSVEIVSGLRNKITLGSPVALLVKNRDSKIIPFEKDSLPALTVPRPAHADLAGVLKYGASDIRNILERASARETVMRVAVGSICKQFLSKFNIRIAAFTVAIGSVLSTKKPLSVREIEQNTKDSLLQCIDKKCEQFMVKEIKNARESLDSLGGVIEVWTEGVLPGLGSCMYFDRRLDSRIAAYIMSIPAVKGIEFGLGFEYARKTGSKAHDPISYGSARGFYHTTNNSGGIEGGISTGEPIVLRLAMKPIPTLQKPLDSVDIITRKKKKAHIERSDTCAVSACGVIAENMLAIAIADSFLDKFGCDSLAEINRNYNNYKKKLN